MGEKLERGGKGETFSKEEVVQLVQEMMLDPVLLGQLRRESRAVG